jgi:uncharacterized protein YigE (DUF2233 family)
MIFRLILPCIAILLSVVASSGAEANSCHDAAFRGAAYIVCGFDPAKDDLRIFWRGRDGRPFRTFDALADDLKAEGHSLIFAMNGGMYDDDFSPVGLYIEYGHEIKKANTATVRGTLSQIPNFYKKPNGVFYIGDRKAGILDTKRFLASRPKSRFATQSGPMLVIDRKIHPAFIVNSIDRKPRDGVGISVGGELTFVISKGAVNFYDFASFFRDGLQCANALFLDGGVAPGLYAPELGRNDPPAHGGYGPIIGVVK